MNTNVQITYLDGGGAIVRYPVPTKWIEDKYLLGPGWNASMIRASVKTFLDTNAIDEDDTLYKDRISKIADRFVEIVGTPRKIDHWSINYKQIACADADGVFKALGVAQDSIKKIQAMKQEGIVFDYGPPPRALPNEYLVGEAMEDAGGIIGGADFSLGA